LPKTLIAITGASSGIGAAFARRLAPQHDLLLIARRKDKLHSLAAEFVKSYGCKVEVLAADLAQEPDTQMVAARLESAARLILLVNNAGFGLKGRFWESPLEAQEEMHKLHVMATVRLTHAALKNLTAQDSGGIINVSSVASFIRSQGSVSYCATKSWMTVFTEGLHLELKSAGSKVRIQALCPGFTYSEFHDTMAADRSALAGGAFWHSAEFVVDASLDGLRRNKLFVIPGWRYRLLTALVTKLPSALRLRLEEAGGRRRARQILQAQEESRKLASAG
jgi:short-subunit dehydrogenase